MNASDGTAPLRLYFAVVFWGEEYRRYFLDYCLASLLAAGNLPAIADRKSARLLIATTADDWRAVQDEPVFRAAKALIAIEHLPYEVPAAVPNDEKMAVASRAHKALAQRMFEDRAKGCFLYPDIIIATNFIAKLQQLAQRGTKAVLFMNVRFANETALAALQASGAVKAGAPLEVSADTLVRLTLGHMHSEMARSRFDGTAYDYGTASFYWPVPGNNIVFHIGSWAPVLIDYGALDRHDAATFDTWTIDGDYVARNFPDPGDVYASTSSDELFLISFTPEARLNYTLKPYWPYRWRWLREALKTYAAHRYLYGHGILDPVKRELFRKPVRLRGGPAPEQSWREVEQQAGRIIEKIERRNLSLLDHLLYLLLSAVRSGLRAPRRAWAALTSTTASSR